MLFRSLPSGIDIAASPIDAVSKADALVVLTEWDEFKWVDPADVATVMVGRTVIDARNLLDRTSWQKAGFSHVGIGR